MGCGGAAGGQRCGPGPAGARGCPAGGRGTGEESGAGSVRSSGLVAEPARGARAGGALPVRCCCPVQPVASAKLSSSSCHPCTYPQEWFSLPVLVGSFAKTCMKSNSRTYPEQMRDVQDCQMFKRLTRSLPLESLSS